MYASEGSTDKNFDASSAIKNTTESYLNWLFKQTGGSSLRADRFNGQLDVLFVSLPQSEGVYLSKGAAGIRDEIEKDMRALGAVDDPKKIYVVYYEGRNNTLVLMPFKTARTLVGDKWRLSI